MRVVLRKSDAEVKDFKRYFVPINFALHAIYPILGIALSGVGLEGADRQAYSGIARVHGHQGSCGFTTGTAGLDFALMFMPLVISYFTFISIFVYTLSYALYVSYRAFMQGDNVLGKLWRTTGPSSVSAWAWVCGHPISSSTSASDTTPGPTSACSRIGRTSSSGSPLTTPASWGFTSLNMTPLVVPPDVQAPILRG